MTSLGRPGVYISETLTPIASTTTDNGTATPVFVGTATYGPSAPTYVSSWSAYAAAYNGFGDTTSLLPYSVYEFFQNGGSGCYIVRAVASDALAGSVTLKDQQATPANLLTITSKAVGAYSNNVYVTINASATAGRFDFLVSVGTVANIVDRFLDVTLNPTDPRYLITMVNSPTTGSATVSVSYVSTVSPWTTAQTPAAQSGTPLTGGADGTAANINLVTAAESIATLPGILMLNLPGVSSPTTINPLLAWCASVGNVFMVIDGPQGSSTESATVTAYMQLSPTTTTGTTLTKSSYGAVYGPWLVCADPSSLAAGAVRTLPPGGAVLGQYMVSDANAGPYQTPAGTSTALVGVVGVDTTFLNSDLDTLNTAGINVIRSIPGYGLCIVGGRTLDYGMPSRYISIRRTLMYIENLLTRAVQFALFMPNSSVLWGKISSIITQQLTGLMQSGYLASTVASSAFYVTCDSTNNTAATMANGVVNITVGVALAAPAEYIVIDIGLFDSTTSTSNSLV
jgi:phage tail sheath protein FI